MQAAKRSADEGGSETGGGNEGKPDELDGKRGAASANRPKKTRSTKGGTKKRPSAKGDALMVPDSLCVH